MGGKLEGKNMKWDIKSAYMELYEGAEAIGYQKAVRNM